MFLYLYNYNISEIPRVSVFVSGTVSIRLLSPMHTLIINKPKHYKVYIL